MPLAETIKEFVSFILKGVDLIDHTSIFLLRTINHYVTLIYNTTHCKSYVVIDSTLGYRIIWGGGINGGCSTASLLNV